MKTYVVAVNDRQYEVRTSSAGEAAKQAVNAYVAGRGGEKGIGGSLRVALSVKPAARLTETTSHTADPQTKG